MDKSCSKQPHSITIASCKLSFLQTLSWLVKVVLILLAVHQHLAHVLVTQKLMCNLDRQLEHKRALNTGAGHHTVQLREAWLPLQVKVVARPLAGSPGTSPQAGAEGNSPSSQGHPSAAGSPFSPATSPDWHTTPRWPQYANFGAHSSRPMHPSTLSQVTSAAQGLPANGTALQDGEARLCASSCPPAGRQCAGIGH